MGIAENCRLKGSTDMSSMKRHASLLGVVVLSLAAIAVLSFAVRVTEGQPVGGTLVVDVDVDEPSFDAPVGIPGPFTVEGDTGGGAGTYQCWGWIFADGSASSVSQVYNIAGRGAIMTLGQEGLSIAVVGGTGDFRNVRGEAIQVFTGVGFDFALEVDLIGAGR
jgi:hypothetical protein